MGHPARGHLENSLMRRWRFEGTRGPSTAQLTSLREAHCSAQDDTASGEKKCRDQRMVPAELAGCPDKLESLQHESLRAPALSAQRQIPDLRENARHLHAVKL